MHNVIAYAAHINEDIPEIVVTGYDSVTQEDVNNCKQSLTGAEVILSSGRNEFRVTVKTGDNTVHLIQEHKGIAKLTLNVLVNVLGLPVSGQSVEDFLNGIDPTQTSLSGTAFTTSGEDELDVNRLFATKIVKVFDTDSNEDADTLRCRTAAENAQTFLVFKDKWHNFCRVDNPNGTIIAMLQPDHPNFINLIAARDNVDVITARIQHCGIEEVKDFYHKETIEKMDVDWVTDVLN